MRVLLDVHFDAGHLHGQLRASDHAEPVAFSGVLDLVAALEQLEPEPATDPPPEAHDKSTEFPR
jgi:hypothetical protein